MNVKADGSGRYAVLVPGHELLLKQGLVWDPDVIRRLFAVPPDAELAELAHVFVLAQNHAAGDLNYSNLLRHLEAIARAEGVSIVCWRYSVEGGEVGVEKDTLNPGSGSTVGFHLFTKEFFTDSGQEDWKRVCDMMGVTPIGEASADIGGLYAAGNLRLPLTWAGLLVFGEGAR